MLDELTQRRSYNAAVELIDANVTRGLSDKIAFIDPDRSVTYGGLKERTCRFARVLRDLGVEPENRVAILMHDTIDYPVVFWGAIRSGAVAVPLNTYLSASQYAYILADCRASALVVSVELADTIAPLFGMLPQLKHVVLVGATKDRLTPFALRNVVLYEEVIAAASPEPFTADTISDEVAFWLYTSGSTGDPKGVRHVHSSLMATAKLFGQGILGIRTNDIVHSASKLFFAYGLGNSMTFPLSVGATTVLWPHRPTPDGVFEIMRRYHPTIFYCVPSLYTALVARPELGRGLGSDHLRVCVSAGEALPAHIGERWREIVGVEVLDGLGSTEMLQTFLSNRPDDIRYGSTGKPVPGYELRIVDENGRDLEYEIGELIVRGPSAGDGYWNQRAKSRRTFAGEWTYTGDKFRRDADGYYHYCGRTDDMFKVSGMWVSPFDVEAALVSHEAVLEAAVIGREDADGLVKPKAFVVLKNGYTADEALFEKLKVHVKEQAGPWKYPRWIDVRPDLPRTATGKIQRFRLRDED